MTGADEAHYLNAVGLSSRVVWFPDGVSRHLTLRNSQWDVLDRLSKNMGWPQSDIPELAFQLAKEFCTDPAVFEQELRDSFARVLKVAAAHSLEIDDAKANDD